MTGAADSVPTVGEAFSKNLALFPASVASIAVTANHQKCRSPAISGCVCPMMSQGMNAIDEMLEEAVRIGLGAMFDERRDATVVTSGVSGLAQSGPYLMTVSHIDKVLIYGQGLGTSAVREAASWVCSQGGMPLNNCCSPP